MLKRGNYRYSGNNLKKPKRVFNIRNLAQLPQKGHIKQNFFTVKIHQKQNRQFSHGKEYKKWAYRQEKFQKSDEKFINMS